MAMSSDVVRPRDQRPASGAPKGGAPAPGAPVPSAQARMAQFYHDVLDEMKRVSWPDRKTLQDATLRIIVFVLLLGAIIGLMDLGLQFLLVRLPALLFSR